MTVRLKKQPRLKGVPADSTCRRGILPRQFATSIGSRVPRFRHEGPTSEPTAALGLSSSLPPAAFLAETLSSPRVSPWRPLPPSVTPTRQAPHPAPAAARFPGAACLASLAVIDSGPVTVGTLLLLLFISGLCGSIGSGLAGHKNAGCLGSIALGFVGALLGMWLARHLHPCPRSSCGSRSGERPSRSCGRLSARPSSSACSASSPARRATSSSGSGGLGRRRSRGARARGAEPFFPSGSALLRGRPGANVAL